MKKLVLLFVAVLSVLALAACGSSTVEKDKDGNIIVQGVTDTTVYVGNTASTTGAYNSIGLPFSKTIQAVFEYYNAGKMEGGLINGRKIEYVHIDDKSTADGGISGTEQLIEDKKVFALVGHFGTWTVVPTIPTIQEVGIPMVHAATGVNALYFEKTVGNPVMAIQPIYMTDGRIIAARAVSGEGSTGKALANGAKIAIVYSDDDAGKSILQGIDLQLAALANKNFVVTKTIIDTNNPTAAVNSTEGADVILVASNQPPLKAFLSKLSELEKNPNAPIYTSYVNADANQVNVLEANVGDIYMNGWYANEEDDAVKAEYAEFHKIIDASSFSDAEKTELKASVHSKSGYIAATVFIEGLRRVGTNKLTWASYIAAMESAKTRLLLAGHVDYTGGQRVGTDTMSLWKYVREGQGSITTVDGLKTINELIGE